MAQLRSVLMNKIEKFILTQIQPDSKIQSVVSLNSVLKWKHRSEWFLRIDLNIFSPKNRSLKKIHTSWWKSVCVCIFFFSSSSICASKCINNSAYQTGLSRTMSIRAWENWSVIWTIIIFQVSLTVVYCFDSRNAFSLSNHLNIVVLMAEFFSLSLSGTSARAHTHLHTQEQPAHNSASQRDLDKV